MAEGNAKHSLCIFRKPGEKCVHFISSQLQLMAPPLPIELTAWLLTSQHSHNFQRNPSHTDFFISSHGDLCPKKGKYGFKELLNRNHNSTLNTHNVSCNAFVKTHNNNTFTHANKFCPEICYINFIPQSSYSYAVCNELLEFNSCAKMIDSRWWLSFDS